ncbi:MAG: YbaB/EbfC family nucleoid-associated protein [Deltaproteobacteria bacterium]|nr:YbaB/EbfC family nucleoid-associated protein [Deltaproteobacteria bacterium]
MINPLNAGGFLKQARILQEKMAKFQSEAGFKKVSATSGGGMVQATVNGKQELVELKIESEILQAQDSDMLKDLIIAAVNEALKKSKDLVGEEIKSLTGGLNIPGLS